MNYIYYIAGWYTMTNVCIFEIMSSYKLDHHWKTESTGWTFHFGSGLLECAYLSFVKRGLKPRTFDALPLDHRVGIQLCQCLTSISPWSCETFYPWPVMNSCLKPDTDWILLVTDSHKNSRSYVLKPAVYRIYGDCSIFTGFCNMGV